jgi:carboxyl-terminal processing protease
VIVKIDGASTRGFTAEDAVKKLRGAEGTVVTITIAREGEPNRDFKITRQVIHVKSVPYAFQVAPGVGYLRVSTFSETTGDEVRAAVQRLVAGGAKSLVVDLRDNPGGLLSQAVDVTESFVPKGSLVVFTKGRAPGSNEQVFATASRVPDTHPMVVLVNGGSASAAEIVAGAIQDLDRGLVLGTTSFGKGSVQSLIELKDRGTALKLTTGRYYTPSGRSIHRDAWNHLSHDEDTAALDDTTDFDDAGAPAPADTTKRPVFHTLAGRVVYGGGGISPDVVVKADTLAGLSREVERRSLFFTYAGRYAAKHKGEAAPQAVTPETWSDFEAFLAQEKVDAKPSDLAAQRAYLERGMRRELARRMDGAHGDEAAFKVAIEHDPQLARAIDLLSRAHSSDELFRIATR